MTWFRGLFPILGLSALLFVGCSSKPAEPEKADANQEASGGETAEAAPADTGGPVELTVEEVYTLPAADGSSDQLSVEEIKKFLADPKNNEPITLKTPLGLDDVNKVIPENNPITKAKAELGRMLYFDKRLSRDNSVSCATCHDPAMGWAQDTPVAAGIDGQTGNRNSPTVMNRAFGKTQFWDGRAATLEEQSLGPIQNPIEMGFTLDELIERIKGIEGYQLMFGTVFDGKITAENIANAIASFERTVLVGSAPNDYYTQAERFLKMSPEEIEDLEPEIKERANALLAAYKEHPLSDAALRGRELYFGKAKCSLCHVGGNLSDELFYNIGVAAVVAEPDIGRAKLSNKPEDTSAFKTPGLRNIKLSGPYMHDGSVKTLAEVVEFYDKGGEPNPHLHERIKAKLNLTPEEKKDLVIFLEEGLTGPMPNIPAPKLP